MIPFRQYAQTIVPLYRVACSTKINNDKMIQVLRRNFQRDKYLIMNDPIDKSFIVVYEKIPFSRIPR